MMGDFSLPLIYDCCCGNYRRSVQSPAVTPATQSLAVPLSPSILITLLVILGLSVWIFATLVKRETRRRRAIALAEWARSHKLRVTTSGSDVPALSVLKPFNSRIQAVLTNPALTLAKVE